MGSCCLTTNHSNTNQSEKFFCEVIQSLPIRKYEFKELKQLYKAVKQKDINKILQDPGNYESPIHITRGYLFDGILDILTASTNIRNSEFHKSLFDKKDNTIIEVDPEYYFLTYVLSITIEKEVLETNEKGGDDIYEKVVDFADHVEYILKLNTEMNLNGLIKFLRLYLQINLIEFTNLLGEEAKNQMSNSKSNHTFECKLDDNFIVEQNIIKEKIFNNENIENFINKVKLSLSHMTIRNSDTSSLKNPKLTLSHLERLFEEYDFLKECEKIRNYFYLEYSNKL